MELLEREYTEYRGWKAWEEKYKPIKNHFRNDPDEQMFETYGEEVEFVTKADNKYIWTYLQGDMADLLVAGYHYVNRLGYYISSIPWENEDDYALLSVEKECECYDEDREDNDGELGDPQCEKCEGYGMITEYVE
jgi:hypothetical protein